MEQIVGTFRYIRSLALQIADIPYNIKRFAVDPPAIIPMLVHDQERFPGISGWTLSQTEVTSQDNLGLLGELPSI